MTRILAERTPFSSPWLDVVEKDIAGVNGAGIETFYSIRTGEYAAVLALTDDGRIPLVRQYRPAVDREVLELPSGGVDPGESPEKAMRRELREETGCIGGDAVLLGRLMVDSGRMETVEWAYFVDGAHIVGPQTASEPLELEFVTPEELIGLVRSNEFTMSNHLAVLGLALVHKRLGL